MMRFLLWILAGVTIISSAHAVDERDFIVPYFAQGVISRSALEKKMQCRDAMGKSNQLLCECIAVTIPAAVSFTDYVLIVSATNEALQYNQLSPEDKIKIDNTRKARDRCINVENR